MATIQLTKRSVDALRPSPTTQFYWDQKLRGFGLKITPTGHRTYVAQYRTPGEGRRGRAHRVTIDAEGRLTVDQARRKADEILSQATLARVGEDPAAVRRTRREAGTVDEAWTAFLAAMRAGTHRKKGAKRRAKPARPRTITEWDRAAKREWLPQFGSLRVIDVRHDQIERLHSTIGADRPIAANRIVEMLRAFFGWCIRRGHRPDRVNPAGDIAPYEERPRKRYLTVAELRQLETTLTLAETKGIPPAEKLRKRLKRASERREDAGTPRQMDPVGIAIIRFLMTSGWRESEALTLKWEYLDLGSGKVVLPDTKSGESERYVTPAALRVVKQMERFRGRGGAYVFPGSRLGTHRTETRRIWEAVKEHAKLTDVRIHDLRHSVASHAISAGLTLADVGGVLGHRSAQTTQRYAHLLDAAKRHAAERTGAALDAAMNGRETPVTPLRRRRAR